MQILNNNNIDITKIKLVIWDLDNTFWNGLIGENTEVVVDKNCALVKRLTDKGIVNSICSKNDFKVCEEKLKSIGMWEYFVFPSIDWTFKGGRVFQIIKEMNLRPDNVLFIDDEPLNLQNVIAQNNNIMCALPTEAIPSLYRQLDLLKDDTTHKRLKQYQVLSVKVNEMKKCDSDEDFLMNSGIIINICSDCNNEITRIHELVNRTNQLNYTKERSSLNELTAQIESSENQCAYIKCHDKYGDYGLIGFYVLNAKSHKLVHFLFSCRTLGMGIEQYIYKKLGCPQLTVVGSVVTELNTKDSPRWITESDEGSNNIGQECKIGKYRLLFKGPCDLAQVAPFFSDGVDIAEEFTYISQTSHRSIEAFNHTSQILLSYFLSQERKNKLVGEFELIDEEYFRTRIFADKFDFVAISLLNDYSLGLYRKKADHSVCLPYDQFTRDYTKRETWKNAPPTDGIYKNPCSEKFVELMLHQYEYMGLIGEDEIISNLETIRELLPKETHLILVNGAELPYPGHTPPELKDRHIVHIRYNKLIQDRFIAHHQENCHMVDINKYVTDASLYADTINHYKKVVYFKVAEEIRQYIYKVKGGSLIEMRDQSYLKKVSRQQSINMLKRKIKTWLYKIQSFKWH